MCEFCGRSDLAGSYRRGRRSAARSLPCRNDLRMDDLVVRSETITPKPRAARRPRKSGRPAQPRREV